MNKKHLKVYIFTLIIISLLAINLFYINNLKNKLAVTTQELNFAKKRSSFLLASYNELILDAIYKDNPKFDIQGMNFKNFNFESIPEEFFVIIDKYDEKFNQNTVIEDIILNVDNDENLCTYIYKMEKSLNDEKYYYPLFYDKNNLSDWFMTNEYKEIENEYNNYFENSNVRNYRFKIDISWEQFIDTVNRSYTSEKNLVEKELYLKKPFWSLYDY